MSITATEAAPDTGSRMLVVADLARHLSVSEETVRRWAREGRIPRPVRVGRKCYWPARVLKQLCGE